MSVISYNKQQCNAFLNPQQLTQLHPEACLELDAPITLYELHKALGYMNKGKSPGLDGLPPELYLFFSPQVGPLILETIHSAIKRVLL